MKKRFSLFILSVILLRAQAQEVESTPITRNQIRAFLEETKALYQSEDAESQQEAAKRFQALLEQTPEGEMNADALKLAEGMSLLKAGNPEAAVKRLNEIEGFESPELRGQVRQMKGNAQMQLAEAAVTAEDWENAKKSMGEAIESFTNALRENPGQEASRHNLELSRKRLEEIKELEPPPPPEQENQDQEEQDQQDQQDQQEQDQQQQDQEDQQDQQDQQQQQDQQPQQDQQQDQSDQKEQQDQADQQDQQQQDPADQSEGAAPEGSPGEMTDAEELDARQAEQILDAALEQEKHQRRQIMQQRIQVIPVEKDW